MAKQKARTSAKTSARKPRETSHTGEPLETDPMSAGKKQDALSEASLMAANGAASGLFPLAALGTANRSSEIAEKIKELVRLAQEQGYLTYGDINDALPDNVITSEELDDVYTKLRGLEVEIVDQAEVDRIKQADQEEEEDKTRLDILDDPVRMYLKQMGQVPLLTREQEVEISKRIETAETHVRQIINNFGFTAKEHVALARRLLTGKERFDRVIIDKKIDSREQYMRILPRLLAQVEKVDAQVDGRYEKVMRSGLSKREHAKLYREFKKADTTFHKLFEKFYFKQKVLEEFVEKANEVREKFDETLFQIETLENLRRSPASEAEVRNEERKLKKLELTARMTTEEFIKAHDELKSWMKKAVHAKSERVEANLRH